MRFLCALVVFFGTPLAFSAIPNNKENPVGSLLKNQRVKVHSNEKRISSDQLNRVKMTLRLPKANRLQSFAKMGRIGFLGLKSIAFDEKQSLQSRWRALTTLGAVYKSRSLGTLEKALAHKDWFMRNAALIGIENVNRSRSLTWASKLLDDPSLVVRTAAVQTIEKLRGKELEGKLWKKLYSKENFKNGQSLWIRRHIARTLVGFANKGDERRLFKIMSDRDSDLHPYGVAGMEKVYGKPMGYQGARSLQEKRQIWKTYIKSREARSKTL